MIDASMSRVITIGRFTNAIKNMILKLTRKWKNQNAVIGELRVNGEFEAYTLEDPDEAGDRIDAGEYRVIIDFSNRFQKLMPHVLGSQAIDTRGIRIHSGNSQADTIGCILVGTERTTSSITGSRDAFKSLFGKMQHATDHGEHVWLSVEG